MGGIHGIVHGRLWESLSCDVLLQSTSVLMLTGLVVLFITPKNGISELFYSLEY